MSRRDAAASGIAMLVLAATAAGQAKAEELDGQLLARCAEFMVVEGNLNSVSKKYAVVASVSPEGLRLERAQRSLVDRIYELREEISDLPAKTPEGIMAKARVAFYDLSPSGNGPTDPEAEMAFSVLRDILGRTGA